MHVKCAHCVLIIGGHENHSWQMLILERFEDVKAAAPSPQVPAAVSGVAQDKPEILVAAAFVGAFLLAKLLKRLAG